MKNGIGKAALAVVGLALMISLIVISVRSDRQAPKIQFNNNDIIYDSGEDKSVLLNGVSAFDKRDGDVTDSIMIESITTLEDASKAKVVYVAKDSNNNIARDSRIVDYNGKAEDPKQEKETVTEQEQTTQSIQSTEPETTTAYVSQSPEKPVITLVSNDVNITKGSTFNIMSYIVKITDDKDTNSTLAKKVNVRGDYDTTKIGDYKLEITCKDSDGNQSEPKNMTLHVLE